jgi:hydroxyacylglutathione hydrolase
VSGTLSGPEIVALVDEGLGNSSYVVDLGDGSALVVDPARDAERYLAEADRRDLRITRAAETHLHADFVSGSRELAARGAQVVAARSAGLEHPHHGLGAGEELDLGGLTLVALATPGHTPEHLAYLLRDGRRPVALFSGGSLLVGAVARTDLISPEQTEDLARSLWRSIQEQVLSLPDNLPVYPTHGAGSFCSVAPGGERVTTIGRERSSNPLLAAPDEDAFVARLLAGFGTFPPYFLELREVNRRGPRVYRERPTLSPLDVSAVAGLVAGGTVVVDVRPVEAFAAGHIPGSLSIPLRPQFASWLGWLIGRDEEVVFVLDADQDRAELVRQCLAIGYERLAGELTGGLVSWRSKGNPVATVSLVLPAETVGTVVDVRQHNEFSSGHVPGAISMELGDTAEQGSMLPAGPLTVMCGHGERAMSAASILVAEGRTDVSVLLGGPADVVAARHQHLAV